MGTPSAPCGFCGGQLRNWRCKGCGTYFTERNFSFAPAYQRLSENRQDARDLSEHDYVAVTFDQDDQQVHELASVQSGWFLGRRYYDLPAQKRLEEFSPYTLRTAQPQATPAVPLEATPADFYDARNGCGRWRGRGVCLTFRAVMKRIAEAGLTVLDEVLQDEVDGVDYPDVAKVEAALQKRQRDAFSAKIKALRDATDARWAQLVQPRQIPRMTALPAPLPYQGDAPLTPQETFRALERHRFSENPLAYLTAKSDEEARTIRRLRARPEGMVRKPQPPPAVAPWEKVDPPLRRIVWFCTAAQPNLYWQVRIKDANPYGPTDFGVMTRTIGLLRKREACQPNGRPS